MLLCSTHLGARPAASASFFLSLLLFCGAILLRCYLDDTRAAQLVSVEWSPRAMRHPSHPWARWLPSGAYNLLSRSRFRELDENGTGCLDIFSENARPLFQHVGRVDTSSLVYQNNLVNRGESSASEPEGHLLKHAPRSFAIGVGGKQPPSRVLFTVPNVSEPRQNIVSGSGSDRMRGGVSKLPSLAAGRACSRRR